LTLEKILHPQRSPVWTIPCDGICRNGLEIRRGEVLWIHRLGVESQRSPVLIRDQDFDSTSAGTFYEISPVLPVDVLREGQHEEIKAGWFLRKPLGLGFALLSSEFAAFSLALTTLVTGGLDDEGIVGIHELLVR
jgi:hypothetical protein